MLLGSSFLPKLNSKSLYSHSTSTSVLPLFHYLHGISHLGIAAMASLRRSKTMPGDGQTSKFLYTIIKQLDLKTVSVNSEADVLVLPIHGKIQVKIYVFEQS